MPLLNLSRSFFRLPKELRLSLVKNVRQYSSAPASARLNIPIDFSTTPLLNHTSSAALSNPELSESVRKNSKTTRLTLHEAINSSLRHALASDDRTLLFGEDISFGGVFRCSAGLATDFGSHRVFNTPLTEQGIVGFAIGCATQGMRPVAEIQFADYVWPAFDQLVNEAAKIRFRAGTTKMDCGGLVVRMPCGGVGHGALYDNIYESIKDVDNTDKSRTDTIHNLERAYSHTFRDYV
jgi:2-oxoisovalerate dehydrogenase E1 component beta subunit